MTPEQLLNDVARAVRKRQMERTGAGRAFDPEVPPTEAELDNARAALAVAIEACAKEAKGAWLTDVGAILDADAACALCESIEQRILALKPKD